MTLQKRPEERQKALCLRGAGFLQSSQHYLFSSCTCRFISKVDVCRWQGTERLLEETPHVVKPCAHPMESFGTLHYCPSDICASVLVVFDRGRYSSSRTLDAQPSCQETKTQLPRCQVEDAFVSLFVLVLRKIGSSSGDEIVARQRCRSADCDPGRSL